MAKTILEKGTHGRLENTFEELTFWDKQNP